MRRTPSRHAGRSEPIGATTPNRNGLVTRLAWSFIVALLESGTLFGPVALSTNSPPRIRQPPPKNVDTSIGDEPPWSAITPQIARPPGTFRPGNLPDERSHPLPTVFDR